MAVVTDELRAQRMSALESALASNRMEGQEPSPAAKVIFQKYVDGELTLAEMGAAIDELSDREYGPVRISRNERP